MTKKQLVYSLSLMLVSLLAGLTACEQNDNTYVIPENPYELPDHYVSDSSGNVTIKETTGEGQVIWTADSTWILDGIVYVEEDDTLVIEEGTIIKAKANSALVVKQGAKLYCYGSEYYPIIFTSIDDSVYRDSLGILQKETELDAKPKGRWHGLFILGNAQINASNSTESLNIGSISATYGGNDDNDYSGIIRYISIRHAGITDDVSTAALTLAGVGSATKMNNIEVIAGGQDGIQLLGGAVNLKRAIVSRCLGSAFACLQGYNGYSQHWLAIQPSESRAVLCRHTDNNTQTDFPVPTIYNATFVGNNTADTALVYFYQNAGAHYHNSLFATHTQGIVIERQSTAAADSYRQVGKDALSIHNCLFSDVSTDENNFQLTGDYNATEKDEIEALFSSWQNSAGSGIISANNFQPATGTANNGIIPTNSVFDPVSFQGAFQAGGKNWTESWTLLNVLASE